MKKQIIIIPSILIKIFKRCFRPIWMIKCALLISVLITFLIHYSLKNSSKATIKHDLVKNIPLPECNVINQNLEEYHVEIDGQKYPQIIAQYLNNSINFTCLNSSNRIKRILAWNPFFGDFGYGKEI